MEFGEGSFDKGFYFSIPTDSFFTNFRQGDISFGLHPLTKDGGATLESYEFIICFVWKYPIQFEF